MNLDTNEYTQSGSGPHTRLCNPYGDHRKKCLPPPPPPPPSAAGTVVGGGGTKACSLQLCAGLNGGRPKGPLGSLQLTLFKFDTS